MFKLLHIIATTREDDSRTLHMSNAFLEIFREKHPDYVIDELILSKEELPDLSTKNVGGKYILLEGKDLYGNLKESWSEIIQHIERFLSTDLFLISTPMWNFSIPYILKHYIDLIVQPKYLFQFTKSGAEGLVKNKKMIVFTSRGGQYDTAETTSFDFQEPYLRTIFGFVGIEDFTMIKAEGMDTGSQDEKNERLFSAIEKAKTLAREI